MSIVVPVFNSGTYVRHSLDSILAQTHQEIEILVTDDASSDGSADIVASYGNRLRSYRQTSNRGQFANANNGMGMVHGEYIAVYHSDDVYG